MGGQEQTVHSGSACCTDTAEQEIHFQAWDKPHMMGRVVGGKSEVNILLRTCDLQDSSYRTLRWTRWHEKNSFSGSNKQ